MGGQACRSPSDKCHGLTTRPLVFPSLVTCRYVGEGMEEGEVRSGGGWRSAGGRVALCVRAVPAPRFSGACLSSPLLLPPTHAHPPLPPASSPRRARTWPPWRRTTRRWAPSRPRATTTARTRWVGGGAGGCWLGGWRGLWLGVEGKKMHALQWVVVTSTATPPNRRHPLWLPCRSTERGGDGMGGRLRQSRPCVPCLFALCEE